MARQLFVWAGLVMTALSPAWSTAELGLELEVQPSWNGVARSGVFSEVGVRLVSQVSREVTLEIGAPGHTISATVAVYAGEPRLVWIPFPAFPEVPLKIQAWSEGLSLALIERSFLEPAAAARVVATAFENSPQASGTSISLHNAQFLDLTSASFPRTPQAYGVVTAVIVDVAALTRFDSAQVSALHSHLALCGRLIVVGAPPEIGAELKKIAGCGGAALRLSPTYSLAYETVPTLLENRLPSLPGRRDLLSLMERHEVLESDVSVALFVLIYFVAMGTAAVLAQRSWILFVLPLAATGLFLLAWQSRVAWSDQMVWSEAAQGDTGGRYAAVLRVKGWGIGASRFVLPPSATIEGSLPENTKLHFSIDEQGAARTSVELSTRLFSVHHIYFQGAFGGSPAFSLHLHGDRPAVMNTAGSVDLRAVLAWRDVHYAIPSLGPLEKWMPPDEISHSALGPLGKLIDRQTRGEGPILVAPFVPNTVRVQPTSSPPEGWLQLRASAAGDGDSP